MKIALYGRTIKDENREFLTHLLEVFTAKFEVMIYDSFDELIRAGLSKSYSYEVISRDTDLKNIDAGILVSLGGDGTLLDTLTLVRDSGIPVMGINMGSLGFLSSFSKDDIGAIITAIEERSYIHDKRTLVHLDADPEVFDIPYGLNEFTIYKRDTSAMIKIHTYVNEEFLATYYADGLIVATPTGSTGYSISCGGPVIHPNSGSFVITPVAPHNLNVRPVIVPDDSIVSFEIEGRTDLFLCTLDSRFATIDSLVNLKVKKAPFHMNLARSEESGFFNTLRGKLMWGADGRK